MLIVRFYVYAVDIVYSCNVEMACILYNMTYESNWLLIVNKTSTTTTEASKSLL